MPADRLPGDRNVPRVQGPAFGASQRMVVSPGHEADGIIHMPGGQSGHPLSPFWGAGHQDWVHGTPTPFLPGERSTLRLVEPDAPPSPVAYRPLPGTPPIHRRSIRLNNGPVIAVVTSAMITSTANRRSPRKPSS